MDKDFLIRNEEEMDEFKKSLKKFLNEANHFTKRLSAILKDIDTAESDKNGFVNYEVEKIKDVINLLDWEDEIHEKEDIDVITRKMSGLHLNALYLMYWKNKSRAEEK